MGGGRWRQIIPETCLRRFEAGESVKDLAREYGVTRVTMYAHLARLGAKFKKRKPRMPDVDFLSMKEQGLTGRQIAEKTSRSLSSVWRLLRIQGWSNPYVWSNVRPKRVGEYWYYGRTMFTRKPRFHLVKVFRAGNDKLIYQSEGIYIESKEFESMDGAWIRVRFPRIPQRVEEVNQ